MHKIIALTFLTASLAAFPVTTPSFAVDSSISAKCGPDGPEAYKRPGGYCDQIGSNGSLSGGGSDGCNYVIVPTPPDVGALEEVIFLPQERILVAENCIIFDGPEDQ